LIGCAIGAALGSIELQYEDISPTKSNALGQWNIPWEGRLHQGDSFVFRRINNIMWG